MRTTLIIILLLLLIFSPTNIYSQSKHPKLILTKEVISEIQKNIGKIPLFDKSYDAIKSEVDKIINDDIDVPMPKDPGGGYTHERHKQNYDLIYKAGILYSITNDSKYAEFIKRILDKYAILYPTLGLHPQAKDQTPGKLFWQSLNETVWLLHTIQAYDCIYDWLAKEDRSNYEQNIFLPMAKFFSEDSEHEFNLIHNHGTWMVASVGMTGFVLGNDELVQKSLYGSKKDGKGGFLAQLNLLFSPDGYYTEGGYYVRYAFWPFFIFAESIQNNMPDLNIYEFRNQILKKAFYSAMQMTYTNGEFIPINDALKEKSFLSIEIVYALNFVYDRYGEDQTLLSIAKKQDQVSFSKGGIEVAEAISELKTIPEFKWRSMNYVDGPNGDEGGVSILRWGPNSEMECLLFKYSAHGLSHGHFDKLSMLFYDQGREIIQDYGAARFLNVEQKSGGRYLPENNSYALQTIAHNTVVVDETSDFDGIRSISQKFHPYYYYSNLSDPNFQVTSAKDVHSYEGVLMHRTLLMVNDPGLLRPVVIDVFSVKSDKRHQYDLPFYYLGHFISTTYNYDAKTNLRKPLGLKNGYQHLWLEAEGRSDKTSSFTWLNGERYYSITSNTDKNTQILFTEIGASDPNFNLRNDHGIMFRVKDDNHTFVNIIEPHGDFNPTLEYSFNSYPAFEEIKVLQSDDNYTVLEIKGKNNLNWEVMICNNNADEKANHKVNLENGTELSWVGPIVIQK
ncbi:MAG: heparinase II/III family protein [Ignavibacteriaceae bacterium]